MVVFFCFFNENRYKNIFCEFMSINLLDQVANDVNLHLHSETMGVYTNKISPLEVQSGNMRHGGLQLTSLQHSTYKSLT